MNSQRIAERERFERDVSRLLLAALSQNDHVAAADALAPLETLPSDRLGFAKQSEEYGVVVRFVLQELSRTAVEQPTASLAWYLAIGQLEGFAATSGLLNAHEQQFNRLASSILPLVSSIELPSFHRILAASSAPSQDAVLVFLHRLLRQCTPTISSSALSTTSAALAQTALAYALSSSEEKNDLEFTTDLLASHNWAANVQALKSDDSNVGLIQLVDAIEQTAAKVTELTTVPCLRLLPQHFGLLIGLVPFPALADVFILLTSRKWHLVDSCIRKTANFIHGVYQAELAPEVFRFIGSTMHALHVAKKLDLALNAILDDANVRAHLKDDSVGQLFSDYVVPPLLAHDDNDDDEGEDGEEEDLLASVREMMHSVARCLGGVVKAISINSVADCTIKIHELAASKQSTWSNYIESASIALLVQLFMDSTLSKSDRLADPAVLLASIASALPFLPPKERYSPHRILVRVADLNRVQHPWLPYLELAVRVPVYYNAVAVDDMVQYVLSSTESGVSYIVAPMASALHGEHVKHLVTLLDRLDRAAPMWFQSVWEAMLVLYTQSLRNVDGTDALVARVLSIGASWREAAEDVPKPSFAELSFIVGTLSVLTEKVGVKSLTHQPASIVNLFLRIYGNHNEQLKGPAFQQVVSLRDSLTSSFKALTDGRISKQSLVSMDTTQLQPLVALLGPESIKAVPLATVVEDLKNQIADQQKALKQDMLVLGWLAQQSLPEVETAFRNVNRLVDGFGDDPTLAQLKSACAKAKESLRGISPHNCACILRVCAGGGGGGGGGTTSLLFVAVFQHHLRSHTDLSTQSMQQTLLTVEATMKSTVQTFTQLFACTLPWNILERLLGSFETMDIALELDRLSGILQLDNHDESALQTIKRALKAVQLMAFMRHTKYVVEVLGFVRKDALETDGDWLHLLSIDRLKDKAASDDAITMAVMTQQFDSLQPLFGSVERVHLLLIQALREYDVVVDLFRNHCKTHTEFEALRGRLNINLQHDVKNASLLNSVIACEAACIHLLDPQPSFAGFIGALQQGQVNEDVPKHFVNVKTNAGLVQTWLSGTVFSSSQHALLRASLIGKSGLLRVLLQRQSSRRSTFVVQYHYYYESHTQKPAADFSTEAAAAEPTHSLDEKALDDHRRQLAFYLSADDTTTATDASKERTYEDAQAHVALLAIIDRLIKVLLLLEEEGHPKYQQHTCASHDVTFDIHSGQMANLEAAAERLEAEHAAWTRNLAHERKRCLALSLFSLSEISAILSLLRPVQPTDNPGKTSPLDASCAVVRAAYPSSAMIDFTPQQTVAHIVALCLRSAHPIVTVDEDRLPELVQSLVTWYREGDNPLPVLNSLLDHKRDNIVVVDLALWSSLPEGVVGSQSVMTLPSSSSQSPSAFLAIMSSTVTLRRRMPCSFEVLWCKDDESDKETTGADEGVSESDLRAFFQRIAQWKRGLYYIVNPNLLSPALQKALSDESRKLSAIADGHHGELIFITSGTRASHVFSHASAPWLRLIATPLAAGQQPDQVTGFFRGHSSEALSSVKAARPRVQLVMGAESSGKSHFIEHRVLPQHKHVLRLTVNGLVDRLSLSPYLLPMTIDSGSKQQEGDGDGGGGGGGALFISVSYQAQLATVNRLLFDLLVLGALRGEKSGLVCALPKLSKWTVVIEWPSDTATLSHLGSLLASEVVNVTNQSYPLRIGEREVLVGTVCKELSIVNKPACALRLRSTGKAVEIPLLRDESEVRGMIEAFLSKEFADAGLGAPNRLHIVMFTSLMHRRAQFFTRGQHFRFNQLQPLLGTTIALQLQKEVLHMIRPSFTVGTENSPLPTYLIFDSAMNPKLLCTSWDSKESQQLARMLGVRIQPITGNTWIELIAHAFDINNSKIVQDLLAKHDFVLLADFTYRLLFVHERKQSLLPLIIESDTGVGKTYLLNVS